MSRSSLAEFIDENRQAIVAEWEAFARSLLPVAGSLDADTLRDHADEILSAIVHDMKSRQTEAEQVEKSKGRGEAQRLEAIGQVHASLRIENGFKLTQMVAEYRALRASVLRLWEKGGSDPAGVTRFNESIDEALVEAVECFTTTTEHYRDQTLGILGHDLRNPLSSIVMGATLLIGTEGLDDRTLGIAARMLSSGKRMTRMVGDLLDLTRTRAGDTIPVERAPIDLEPLGRQVAAELEPLCEPGGLRFSSKGDVRAELDADRIAQVLSNLLRNAIQHGRAGGAVGLVIRDDGDHVALDVHNEGPRIPEAALATIFDPMVRNVQDDPKNTGLGLGLYIAQQVVLAHEGTLEVTSDAKGTTFTARLPRAPAPPPAATVAPPGRRVPPAA